MNLKDWVEVEGTRRNIQETSRIMVHSISKVQFSRCHFNCVASPEVVKSSA